MRTKATLHICLMVATLLLVLPGVRAQCDFDGQVIDGSNTPECGLVILSYNTWQVLVPVGNTMGIQAGQIVKFSYEAATQQSTCNAGAQIKLTCLTVINSPVANCNAGFHFTINPSLNPSVYFEPSLMDNSLSYNWDFGDGNTSPALTPEHTFNPGVYEVCLTVSGNSCNQVTSCKTVDLTAADNCGYMVSYDFQGTSTIVATVFNITGFGPFHPDAVEWLNPATGAIIGTTPVLTYDLPAASPPSALCASFTVLLPDGETCQRVVCQPFNPAPPGCLDWSSFNTNIPCPATSYPVCGCDGVTYINECQALYHGGVTTWTNGPCPGASNPCVASFYTVENGNDLTLYNTSIGTYTAWEWNLGDGTILTNQNTLSYTYQTEGIYPVCLTVWNGSGCSSEFCDYIFTGPEENLCNYTDCVYPGDVDLDNKANVYDLLPIGVGYGKQGPPRGLSAAGIEWAPHFGPDWNITTINDTDYKHIDCNGDGVINDFDADAIEANYIAPSNVFSVQAPGAPLFWLDFKWDTIVVDDNSPEFIEIEASLMAGTPQTPVSNLRGFALQLDYPEDMVMEDGIEVAYNNNSILGNSNHVLWLKKDRFQDNGELDLGFAKKINQTGGFGKIADVTFIVISDVIARSESAVPFVVPVKDIVAVNKDGALLTLGVASEDAKLIILNQMTTGTNSSVLDRQVLVFPNPAMDQLNIRLGQLTGNLLEVFNPLGQQLLNQPFSGNSMQLNTGQWEPGLYFLRIHTDKGVVSRKVVIE